MQVTVLGAGSYGTALSILLARNGCSVTLYGRDPEDIESLQRSRQNARYLPGFEIPVSVHPTSSPELPASELWIVAVPTGAVRDVVPAIVGDTPTVVVASKGLEAETAMLPVEVVLGSVPGAIAGVLSGPNLAIEIVRGIPTAAVAAFADQDAAERTRQAFMCQTFRVYLSKDVVGVELAGALKNVLAIGAGISDALGFGDNTKGAFLARGLTQMAELGRKMGACPETFLGIAGVGDLFATAVSKLSRNYRLGFAVGSGVPLEKALEELGQVAEGVPTSHATRLLADRYLVEMPVFEAVDKILLGELGPRQGVQWLMERSPKAEA